MSTNFQGAQLQLEKIITGYFDTLTTIEEDNIEAILKATLWLYDSAEERLNVIEEAISYLHAGGRDVSLFIALMSYKAVEKHQTNLNCIRSTFMNRIRFSDNHVNLISPENAEELVLLFWRLLFGIDCAYYTYFLMYHDGETIDLLKLPEMRLEEEKNSYW